MYRMLRTTAVNQASQCANMFTLGNGQRISFVDWIDWCFLENYVGNNISCDRTNEFSFKWDLARGHRVRDQMSLSKVRHFLQNNFDENCSSSKSNYLLFDPCVGYVKVFYIIAALVSKVGLDFSNEWRLKFDD